jgi:hypothetical protein
MIEIRIMTILFDFTKISQLIAIIGVSIVIAYNCILCIIVLVNYLIKKRLNKK